MAHLRPLAWLLVVGLGFSACTGRDAPVTAPDEESPPSNLMPAGEPTDEHVFVSSTPLPSDFSARVAAEGGTVVHAFDEIGVAVTRGLSDRAAKRLAKGGIKVERDIMVQWIPRAEDLVFETTSIDDPQAQAHNPAAAVFFACCQWNMRIIDADDAWAQFSGDPGIRVAILDTGLDPDHIDQRFLIDVASSVAFTPSISPKPGPPWRDDNFHGTHVGSIVVSNGIGTSGVAPHVQLIAVKVLNAAGSGSFGNVIAGIIHAADVGADVINLSLGASFPKNATGGGPLVAALNKAVNYANSRGSLVVSAAGNDNRDLQHDANVTSVPCESGTGMCISATDRLDQRASYSNFGTNAIDVSAPGGDFDEPLPPTQQFILGPCSSYTTLPALAVCATSPTFYVFVVGTSQATPHVSGTAALLKANTGQSASQLETTIQQTAEDLGKPGSDPVHHHGRINVCQALGGVGCT